MALSNAERQRSFRERLMASLSPSELVEYKKKRSEQAYEAKIKREFAQKLSEQFEEWLNRIKIFFLRDPATREKHLIEGPLFVPRTPYFEKIVKVANLEEDEIPTWEIIYHGLCAWQLVAANKTYFGSKYKLKTIEKLVAAGAIMYQPENGFGMAAFSRGKGWPFKNEYDTTPIMPNLAIDLDSPDYFPRSTPTPFIKK